MIISPDGSYHYKAFTRKTGTYGSVGNTASSFFDNNYQAAKFPSHGMNIQ
jgi:hypothetical protein